MNKSTASSSVCIIGLNVHCTVGYRRLKLVLALLGLLGQAVTSPGGDESKLAGLHRRMVQLVLSHADGGAIASMAMTLQPTLHKPQR